GTEVPPGEQWLTGSGHGRGEPRCPETDSVQGVNHPETPHHHAAGIRDYTALVDRVFIRGPQSVADEIAAQAPDGTDFSSPQGHLRWLLLSHAHLLVRPHDRAEVACVLHDLI